MNPCRPSGARFGTGQSGLKPLVFLNGVLAGSSKPYRAWTWQLEGCGCCLHYFAPAGLKNPDTAACGSSEGLWLRLPASVRSPYLTAPGSCGCVSWFSLGFGAYVYRVCGVGFAENVGLRFRVFGLGVQSHHLASPARQGENSG